MIDLFRMAEDAGDHRRHDHFRFAEGLMNVVPRTILTLILLRRFIDTRKWKEDRSLVCAQHAAQNVKN
jgi:hypothetical protein